MVKKLCIYLAFTAAAGSAGAKTASIRISPVSSLLGSPSGEVSVGVARYFSLGIEANYDRSLEVVDRLLGYRSRSTGGRATATFFVNGFDRDSFYFKLGGGARRVKVSGFRESDFDGAHGTVTRKYDELQMAPMIGYQWVAGGDSGSGFTVAIGLGSVFAYPTSDVNMAFSRRDRHGDASTTWYKAQPIKLDGELRVGFAI